MKDLGKGCLKRIETLLAEAPAKWTKSICAGTCINRKTGEDCSEIKYYGRNCNQLSGAVCHYWTRSAMDKDIVFNTTKNIETEAQKAFIEWVVKGSPFAYGVLNSDNLDQIYHGGMVIDVSLVGEGGTFWLCKAARYIYESPGRVEQFGRLVKLGLPPKAAFFVCSSYGNYYGEGTGRGKEGNLSTYRDHNQVMANMDPKVFVKAYKVNKAPKVSGRETSTALGAGNMTGYETDWLGFGSTKVEKVPDGWGGFTEKRVAVNEEQGVAKLIEFLKKEGCI